MRWALAMLMVAVAVGCGDQDAGPVVSEARIGEPTGPNAALYLTVTGEVDDRLIGASTDVAAEVVLHETVIDADGTMSMRPVDGLDLPAGGSLLLEPGGYHLMLIDVDRLQVGDNVEVSLIWEEAGETTVEAEVVSPDATMSHDG